MVFLKVALPTSIISKRLSAKTHGWQNATTHLPSSQIWSHVADSWLKRCWLTWAATCSRSIQAQQKPGRRDVSWPSSVIQDFHTKSLKALRAQSSLSSSYTQEALPAVSTMTVSSLDSHPDDLRLCMSVIKLVQSTGAPVQPVCNTIYEEWLCLPCAGHILSFQVQVVYFLSDCMNAGWEGKGGKSWSKDRKNG